MKIGIVCYPTLGGSGIVATELGHELAMRGHEVHLIAYEMPFRLKLEKNIFFHEVEINQYELFKYPDYALALSVKIAAVAQKYNLDILHVHYAIPHATSAYLAKQILGSNRPAVITTLHGTDITLVGKDPAYLQIVKFSIENSCGVTAVSKSLRQQTYDHFGITKPIEVIYNFFIPDQNLIGKKPLKNRFASEGEKLLLHASNYRPVKRPQDVVKIFMEIRKKVKSKLLFLGTGSGIEAVRRMVSEMGLNKEVFFFGKSRDIDPFIASADLFLLPSAQESFGLAALEAMAYGVPAIASDIGGLPELIENGKSGYLAPVGDIDRMAEYAIHLLTDSHAYESMSQEAKKQACEKFCTAKIIPQYEAYYELVLKSKRPLE